MFGIFVTLRTNQNKMYFQIHLLLVDYRDFILTYFGFVLFFFFNVLFVFQNRVYVVLAILELGGWPPTQGDPPMSDSLWH